VRRLGLGCLLFAALACDPGGPTEPEDAMVTLQVVTPPGVERPASLRLAVVWRTGAGSGTPWVTTFDHALGETEQSHRVRLALPESVDVADLADSVRIAVDCADLGGAPRWPGVRPLCVAYQDLNRNQRLDGEGSDRVWGATDFDSEHVAAFVDLEALLSEVSLEGAECLRAVVGGGFSPFASGVVFGQDFYASLTPSFGYTVRLTPTELPGAVLNCGPSVASIQGATIARPDPILAVPPELGLDACSDAEHPCTVVAYDDEWLGSTEAVTVPGYGRSARCVASGELEVLWIAELGFECEDCACVRRLHLRGWVAPRDARPVDWPCGASVDLCATPSERVELIPDECLSPT